ncbi:DUF1569 domain-containing protein [Portibacter lacus]|nr:DUF1569 domain-containing protein [Portibacter lacus]
MTIRNLFAQDGLDETLERISNLTPETKPQWGKMDVAQMLAHCNVAYDMALTAKYPISGKFKTFMISLLAKKAVVGPKPYPKNSRTAPDFLITDEREYEKEKAALIANLKKTHELGSKHFDGKTSVSFGNLSTDEWNVLFSKHLDHHLTQFGV